MEYTALGRTGLKVSVMGLGCGGYSCLGQKTGKSEKESISVVQRAIDLGINFFDTAETYGTEAIVGKATKKKWETVVLSTKKAIVQEGILISSQEMIKGMEQSLLRLNTDHVEIFNLHGVKPQEYEYAVTEVLPVLLKMRKQGKIRFIGITESFSSDPHHRMLERAMHDNCWDVIMVGFNILNQSARERIFFSASEKNIGVIVMYAVRRVLSRPERLRQLMAELKKIGLVDPALFDEEDPLGFLIHGGEAISLPDAGYRYCRDEPGVHVILSGTGNLEHLDANVNSILRPPLPDYDLVRLRELFSKVDNISGD